MKCVRQNISISKHKHIIMSLYLDSLWYVERNVNRGSVVFMLYVNSQHDITKTLRTFLYIQCFVIDFFCYFVFLLKKHFETK